MRKIGLIITSGLILQGCLAAQPGPQTGPDMDENGACFAQDETPATIETITSHVQIAPAEYDATGKVITPARYRTETRQRIVEGREAIRFRTPCQADLTPQFITTLQRALAARQVYRGQITGQMNSATRQAVRAYQSGFGINSAVLSLEGAQRLGLISLSPAQLQAASTGQGNPFSVPAGL